MYSSIKNIQTHHTGGGCWVDIITLATENVICISDEAICQYNSEDDFYDGEDPIVEYFYSAPFTADFGTAFIRSADRLNEFDIIELYSGHAIAIHNNTFKVLGGA